MKQAMSLEEEKRRLLEQFEHSREVYRLMLTGSEHPSSYEAPPASYGYYASSPPHGGGFPQSQTMQWIIQHPYLVGFGAVALAVVGKRRFSKTKNKRKKETSEENASVKKGLAATTLGTAAAMMLRNPAQMRAAIRAVTIAVNYFK